MTTFNNTVAGNEHAIVGVAVGGIGVHGTSKTSTGAGGVSDSGIGVHGVSKVGPGVRGDAPNGVGVFGSSRTSSGTGGVSDSGIGVHGISATAQGVVGSSTSGVGVMASSTTGEGLHAESSSEGAAAVAAINTSSGPGLFGVSERSDGVVGLAKAAGKAGVVGRSDNGVGVIARSTTGEAVHAETLTGRQATIAAYHRDVAAGSGAALFAKKDGDAGHAGFFDGAVEVTRALGVGGDANIRGTLTVDVDIQLSGGDIAEQFEVVGELTGEPGSVVVLVGEDRVRLSDKPYDSRVAGVISGAVSYRPALVMDRREGGNRRPVALTGKVWCKVDADHGPVGLGDVLTTSPTPGHAMRATDPALAFGSVIGKALGSLRSGRGLVPLLVALQ